MKLSRKELFGNMLRRVVNKATGRRCNPRIEINLAVEMLEDRLLLDASPIALGTSDPQNITNVDGVAFFSAIRNAGHGRELFKSDGTIQGTRIVRDIRPGVQSSYVANLQEFNGRLLFDADDGIHGRELWTSDGTETGTHMLSDIHPGSASSEPSRPFVWKGKIFFSADNGILGQKLWISDGTEAGTRILNNIIPFPNSFTVSGDSLFFEAYSLASGDQLWKTDGTSAGTRRVSNIDAGGFRDVTDVDGTLFFTARNWMNGVELYKSDGTIAGTQLLKDINPGTNDSYLNYFAALNGQLIFSAYDGTESELWTSDGTVEGTRLLKDIRVGIEGSNPRDMIRLGDGVMFSANSSGIESKLWRTDGTTAGTKLVSNGPAVESTVSLSTSLGRTVKYDGRIYFSVFEPNLGSDLWNTDGTTNGTMLVKDTQPGPGKGNPTHLTSSNGLLYFSAKTRFGRELYRTDGTAAGTRIVDLTPDFFAPDPDNLIDINGSLFLTAVRRGENRQLFVIPQTQRRIEYSGTPGDDDVEIRVLNDRVRVTINDDQYEAHQFENEKIDVVFDGFGGNDTVRLVGGAASAVSKLYPDRLVHVSDHERIRTENVEQSTVIAGSATNNRVYFFDSPGRDRYTGAPGIGQLKGNGFKNTARNFDYYYANSSEGIDKALINGSPEKERFVGKPNFSQLSGSAMFQRVKGFRDVYSTTNTGASDLANLFGSSGNDRFDRDGLGNSQLKGAGFSYRLFGFRKVVAFAGGGNDQAILIDGYGDDILIAKQNYTQISDANGLDDLHRVFGFERVTAIALRDGNDQAFMFDSPGADTFFGRNRNGELFSNRAVLKQIGFENVRIYSTLGNDKLDVRNLDYNLVATGPWIEI